MRHRILPAALCALTIFAAAGVASAGKSADVSAALNVSALQLGKPTLLAVVVEVHEGLHAQSHTPTDENNAVKFEVQPDENASLEYLPAVYPTGEMKAYVGVGTLNVYAGRVIVYVPVKVKAGAAPGPVKMTGKVILQACNATGECFLPERPKFSIDTHVVGPGDAVASLNAELFAGASADLLSGKATLSTNSTTAPATAAASSGDPAAPLTSPPAYVPNSDTSVSLFGRTFDLKKRGIGAALLVAFVAGLFFNIVPCVLPVLPLKAIGFYEVSQHNRAKTLLFGFIFSLGLVSVFAALASVVLLSKSLFGTQVSWGQQFSYPWFVWTVAVVLGALGFGMLGAFTFNLPTSIYGLDFRHDTLSGNFLWGALTAVLSTPCTAPLFPAVIIYALALPKFVGFVLVSMVGVGMASPYFLLSAFPEVARKFPRTGAFAELVKQMMGFLLLGSAAFFAGTELLGEPNQWWLVFAVVVWGCLYLVIRTPQIIKTATALYISTALAVAITGGALVLTLRLTDFFPATRGTGEAAAALKWEPYAPETLAAARKANKPVLVDFTANWCLNCKTVETTVFRDPRTIDALKKHGFVTLRADLTNHGAPGFSLYDELGLTGIPYTAVYLPGEEKPVGLASIYTTDTLLGVIDRETAAGPVAAASASEK